MSIVTDYYNNEAVFSFTSETAFTLPSYNSRAVITIKNLSSPSLTLTPFGSETIDGAATYVVGGTSTAKIIKGETGWVVVELQDKAGTATNDAAGAGQIGELLSAQLLAASTTSLVTATAKDITTLSLTAGDWEVSGVIHFVPANTTTVQGLVASISATTNTAASPDAVGGYANSSAAYTSTGVVNSVTIPAIRISLAATTTYYLVATATFGVSTCTGYGTIRARRLR